MIVFSYCLVFVAVILDGLVSNLFYSSSDFLFLTLLFVFPFFMKKRRAYMLLFFIGTMMYDILYTNILFLTTTCFLLIYVLMDKTSYFLRLKTFVGYYLFYHVTLFSLLYIVGYTKNIFLLVHGILQSSIFDFVYVVFLFLLLRKRYPKRKINYS